MKTFAEWLDEFIAFKIESEKILNKPIPDDLTLLKYENQRLEPMQFQANEHAAQSIKFYYGRKTLEIKKLVLQEWPRSSVDGVAKAASFLELEASESAVRLVKTITSRIFAVKDAMKILEMK